MGVAKPKTIFWHCLAERTQDAQFVSDAVAELQAVLLADPFNLRLDIRPLPDDLASILLPDLHAPNIEACVRAVQPAQASHSFGVSIYCDPDQPVGRAARARLPHAVWGISMKGLFSLTYCRGNKQIFWHETLHLLGAQDHYDPIIFRTKCELPTCIMQYAPSEITVGKNAFLCRQTQSVLQRACGIPIVR